MGEEHTRNGPAAAEISRHRRLSGFWRWAFLTASALSILLAVYQLFTLGIYTGFTPLANQYLYGLIILLLPPAFLLWPAWARAPKDRVPWYDAALYAVALAVGLYYAVNGELIIYEGWEYAAPDQAVWVSYVFWLLVLEATRRAGGVALLVIVTVVSFYPLYAQSLPGILAGQEASLADTAMFHAMSEESILGIPMRAFGNLVIGFLIFGVALQHTGGGRFFLNLAFALLGHVRGGPAKVAIFASGLMGSMSGSVITNVLTTGVLTIPAMKRVGFERSYAGGVETCASTGGVLMPPVMGATAFVMATFLEVPYVEIAIAAVIPSILYFFGLFMQIDANAARNNLAGLPRAELPSLRQTFKEGWYFVVVFALLVWMLVFLNRESWAPFFATALLLAVNQAFPYHRWGWSDAVEFIAAVGRLFAELAAILAGVGLIVGALVVTGKLGNLANDLLSAAGGQMLVLLAMGALTSFVLGIGMTVTAAYIFLAIALAPALIQGGLNPMSVHLFILYWGMLSYITPPVALGAYAAASVAQANPMRTGFQAMRLGSIIYFIPFFFVLEPALILEGTWPDILLATASAFLGVVLVAGALQGYLVLIGDLTRHTVLQWPLRGLILLAGLLLATPGGGLVPWSNLQMAVTAAFLMVGALTLFALVRRRSPA
jgi:TRAP transporter 4TM/12TM fusion protein